MIFYYDRTSSFCLQAKKWLDDHGIGYELKDIASSEILDELYAKTEQIAIPTLVIEDKVLIGFRPRDYEETFLHKESTNVDVKIDQEKTPVDDSTSVHN